MMMRNFTVFLLVWSYTPGTMGLSTPAVPGTSVTFTCLKPPSPNLVWEHVDSGRVVARGGVVDNNTTSLKYGVRPEPERESLTIRSVTLADDGSYRCFYQLIQQGAQFFTLNVLIIPESMQAIGPRHPVSEGTRQVLRCEVIGAKPLPSITWIRKEVNGKSSKLEGSNTDAYREDKTGSRINNLEVTLSRRAFRAVFTCQAKISFFYTLQENISLDVFLLPLVPEISGTGLSYDPGAMSSLQCVVRGARPPAQITWSLDGNKVESINNLPESQPDGTFVSTSTLLMTVPSWEADALLTCSATNQAVLDSRIVAPTANTTLKMNFAPTVKANFTRSIVKEGSDTALYCFVSSRPLPSASEITWTKGGLPINVHRYNIGNASNPFLVIRNVERHDAGRYQCHVSNHLGSAKSEPITLEIQYRPYCSADQQTRLAVPIGSTATVKCIVGSYPNDVTFVWFYQEDVNRISTTTELGLTDAADPTMAYSFYNVTVRGIEDYRSVVCNASNSVGLMRKSCFIQLVRPGPSEAPENCSLSNVTNMSVRVRCKPGFDGGSQQRFILRLGESSLPYRVFDTWDVPDFHPSGLQPDTEYRLSVCSQNEKYSDTRKCSQPMTVKTLAASPVGDDPPVEVAGIEAYVALGVCLFLMVAVVAVGLIYWRYWKNRRGHKPSPGRGVVVARSTGSLILDQSDTLEKKMNAAPNGSYPDMSSKEKQLMAIVDRINWREGLQELAYISRCPEVEDRPNRSTAALTQESNFGIASYESLPNLVDHGMPRADSSHRHHRHTPTKLDKAKIGVHNPGFDHRENSGPPESDTIDTDSQPGQHTGVTKSSVEPIADQDRHTTHESEMVAKSSVTAPGKHYIPEMNRSLRSEHLFEGLARSGSYNLAIAEGEQSSPKSTRTSGSSLAFNHQQDARYRGIKPVYF